MGDNGGGGCVPGSPLQMQGEEPYEAEDTFCRYPGGVPQDAAQHVPDRCIPEAGGKEKSSGGLPDGEGIPWDVQGGRGEGDGPVPLFGDQGFGQDTYGSQHSE